MATGGRVLGDFKFKFFSSLNQGRGLRTGDVFELSGDHGTGKSEIFLNMVAEALIPKYYQDYILGGKEIGVVFISTNYKFDLLRLVEILEHKLFVRLSSEGEELKVNDDESIITLRDAEVPITSKSPPISFKEPSINRELIKNCLKKLYVLNCDSIHSLTLTVIFLKQFLLGSPHIELILIDHALTTEHVRDEVSPIDPMKWLELLVDYSRQYAIGIITEPETPISNSEINKYTYHIRKTRSAPNGSVFTLSSVNFNQSWDFTVNNDGIAFGSN
ncbi:PREDICTED: DNA repair protein XRCC2-like [Amphimedon queenslandica]|uniref:DNA recombination and repair protein Rad51-like C-terminal domain-containing protein n=1 Tax=Amphimedon queenslandica TaxID=400682 RepID=A0A1X7UR21_AMPQE|nr:PREDICTED: DNA repair protein XRCC2-like [Amphimedon queenslandica]|eukprot:XP_011404337.1 PREDICTED: DNA repair protein XRCC2-like [Amphimedon queenslandica]